MYKKLLLLSGIFLLNFSYFSPTYSQTPPGCRAHKTPADCIKKGKPGKAEIFLIEGEVYRPTSCTWNDAHNFCQSSSLEVKEEEEKAPDSEKSVGVYSQSKARDNSKAQSQSENQTNFLIQQQPLSRINSGMRGNSESPTQSINHPKPPVQRQPETKRQQYLGEVIQKSPPLVFGHGKLKLPRPPRAKTVSPETQDNPSPVLGSGGPILGSGRPPREPTESDLPLPPRAE